LYSNKLLSIDWDYVTGDCSIDQPGCRHPHCGFCEYIKTSRIRGAKNKFDIVWGDEKRDKLLKLKVNKGTPIYVAECHANIMDLIKQYKCPLEVYDYDTHYDSYDEDFRVHCGNWIYHLELLGGKVNCKPSTIDKVDAIFICHSSPWTPRCMDEAFFEFIVKMTKKTKMEAQFIGHRQVSLRNEYKRFI